MNLVVGATGLLGSEICRLLADKGQPVKALVRTTSDPVRVDALKQNGVEIDVGDLKDRSSLDAACRDVTSIISTASATLSRQEGDTLQTVDLEGQLQLVDAARAAEVKWFVFVSFRTRKNPSLQYPLKMAKRAVEEHLQRSGMAYTILQAGYFMEVWLGPALDFDHANAKVRVYGAGQNPLSWVSFADVAQFAVACLDNPAARNAILEVGGPEALSPLQVVQIFEEVKGQKFTLEHVPEEVLRAQKAAATDPLQETFAALMLQYAGGDAIDMEATLETFRLRLTSVKDYARRVSGSS